MQPSATILYSSYVVLEKNGKTLHLLKSKSKPVSAIKKRRKIEIMGTFGQYQDSKKKPVPSGNMAQALNTQNLAQGAQQILNFAAPGQAQMAPAPKGKDAKMNAK